MAKNNDEIKTKQKKAENNNGLEEKKQKSLFKKINS